MAISKENVFAAADELVAVGQRPTLEAVRQRVGGSYTTLSPLLVAWKEAQARAAVSVRDPMPQAVSESLATLGGTLWNVALKAATARFSAERAEMETVRADAVERLGEATALADTLRAEVEGLRRQLIEEQASAAAEVQRVNEQLASARAECDEAGRAAVRAREDVAGLRGQLVGMKEQYEALLGRLDLKAKDQKQ